jgi:hypothetical protein
MATTPLPPQYAVLNTPDHPHAGLDRYIDDRYQQTGQVPDPYQVQNGHLVLRSADWIAAHPDAMRTLGPSLGLGDVTQAYAADPTLRASSTTSNRFAPTEDLPSNPVGTGDEPPIGPPLDSTPVGTGDQPPVGQPPSPQGTNALNPPPPPPDDTKKSGGGGFGLPSWLTSLLKGGGDVAGAALQAQAIEDAANLQAKSTAAALAFQQKQYADLTGRLQPYITTGTTAADRMNQILSNGQAQPFGPSTSTPPPPSTADPTGGHDALLNKPIPPHHPPPSFKSPFDRGPNTDPGRTFDTQPMTPTVLMQAPDGSQMAVNRQDVPHYQQRGAVVVPGAA